MRSSRFFFIFILIFLASIAGAYCGILFFSDHPERVNGRGLLFSGGITKTFPVRLFYYHQGDKSLPDLSLLLQLFNPGVNREAKLEIIKYLAPPSLNPYQAGHQAVKSFLVKLMNRETETLIIPSGQSVDLCREKLLPDFVANGIIEFKLLSGGPVFLNLFALKTPEEPPAFNLLVKKLDTHCRGAFPLTQVTMEKDFDLAKESGEIYIGKEAYENILPGRVLKGGYGILYRIRLKLVYTASKPGKASVFFQPRGGGAALVFFLGDEIRELKPVPAYDQVLLFRVNLKAGEKKELEIYTMPEGASSYPVKIMIRSSWR